MPSNIQLIDESILFFIQEHLKSPTIDWAMVLITSLGNAGLFWIAAAFLLMLIKRYQKCGFAVICTLSLSRFLGDDVLKPLIGRVRPCYKFPEIALLIPAPHAPSFPSGHTMVSFACATVIYYYNKRLGMVSFVIAALIAFSRLYLFVHYPSDVLGGMIFGILTSVILLLSLNLIYSKLEKSFPSSSISPEK